VDAKSTVKTNCLSNGALGVAISLKKCVILNQITKNNYLGLFLKTHDFKS
jgi:hypothetical protein